MEHIYLKPNARLLLSLQRFAMEDAIRFRITGYCSETQEAVSYHAIADGTHGILKELYPVHPDSPDTSWLKRDKPRNLCPVSEKDMDTFRQKREAFRCRYTALMQKRQKYPKEGAYLPDLSLLELCSASSCNAGLFVWIPTDDGISAETFFSKPRASRWHLLSVLHFAEALTQMLIGLRNMRLCLPDPTLSDILLCGDPEEMEHIQLRICDPEALAALPETDAGKTAEVVGRVLFTLLQHPDDRSHKHSVEQMLNNSPFCKQSQDVYLQMKLHHLLDGCLSEGEKRLESCQTLLNELKEVLLYVESMTKFRKKSRTERFLANPLLAAQKLLYTNPLYDCLPESDSKPLHILIYGYDAFAKAFMDTAFQICQLPDVFLHITVVCTNPEEAEHSYCYGRPDLRNFLSISESGLPDRNLKYGKVNFLAMPEGAEQCSASTPEQNGRIVGELLAGDGMDDIRYVVISSGSHDKNRSIAKAFAGKSDITANYVAYRREEETSSGQCIPIPVYTRLTLEDIGNDLEDMAWNADMCWGSSVNPDLPALREKFLGDVYRYTASLSYVIAMKYKLHALGISMGSTEASYRQAAAEFQKLLEKDTEQKLFLSLIAYEHRRWIMEMILNGWRGPDSKTLQPFLEYCVQNCVNKDRENKIHSCIVRSDAAKGIPLSSPRYTKNDYEKWRSCVMNPNPDLDALDRMSLCLFRGFDKRRTEILKDTPEIIRLLDCITHILLHISSPSLHEAYQNYRFSCMQLVTSSEQQANYYANHKNKLDAALLAIYKESKNIPEHLQKALSALDALMQVLVIRAKHTDYKKLDDTLIRNIPFILTNRFSPALAMVFHDGTDTDTPNNTMFRNVASSVVLRPSKLCYLYAVTKQTSPEHFCTQLSRIQAYFKSIRLSCPLHIVAVHTPDCSGTMTEIRKGLLRAGITFDIRQCREGLETELADMLLEGFREFYDECSEDAYFLFDGSNPPMRSMQSNMHFMQRIQEYEEQGYLRYFEYDAKTQQFLHCTHCPELQYIQSHAAIRVDDLCLLQGAKPTQRYVPEFADSYQTLWKIYTGTLNGKNKKSTDALKKSTDAWKDLCEMFNKITKESICYFSLNQNQVQNEKLFFFPQYMYRSMVNILGTLKTYHIIADDFQLTSHATETCQAVIRISDTNWNEMQWLFHNPERLTAPSALEFEEQNGKLTLFSYRSILYFKKEKNASVPVGHTILQQLYEHHFLLRYDYNIQNSDLVYLTFASPRIAKLLSKAGDILEIYTYYELLKSGIFDDLVCSYPFSWQGGEVSNELDCIGTKGFRSVIIECKAAENLKQGYYHKLYSLSKQFGIHVSVILVSHRTDANQTAAEPNRIQIERGNLMQIHTISDIKHLADAIRTILETP